ncbi:hypothetical protein G7046_g5708 [Stylonectria norvegica]|nr:hypothetical protein G7046_g5708 [Stylonectria norvegica]
MTGRGPITLPKLPPPDPSLKTRPVPRERHFHVRFVGPGAAPDILQTVRSMEDIDGKYAKGHWAKDGDCYNCSRTKSFLKRVMDEGQCCYHDEGQPFVGDPTWGYSVVITGYSAEAQKNLDSALSKLVETIRRFFLGDCIDPLTTYGDEVYKRFKLDVIEDKSLLEDASDDRVREEFNAYVRTLNMWDADNRQQRWVLNRPSGSERYALCIALDEASMKQLSEVTFGESLKEDEAALKDVAVKVVGRLWDYPDRPDEEHGRNGRFYGGAEYCRIYDLRELYSDMKYSDLGEVFAENRRAESEHRRAGIEHARPLDLLVRQTASHTSIAARAAECLHLLVIINLPLELLVSIWLIEHSLITVLDVDYKLDTDITVGGYSGLDSEYQSAMGTAQSSVNFIHPSRVSFMPSFDVRVGLKAKDAAFSGSKGEKNTAPKFQETSYQALLRSKSLVCPAANKKNKFTGEANICRDGVLDCTEDNDVMLSRNERGGGKVACGSIGRQMALRCNAPDGIDTYAPVSLEHLFPEPPADDVPVEFDVQIPRGSERQTERIFHSNNCEDMMEEGHDGTIIRMPDDCGPGQYIVAHSLKPSQNQTLPGHLEEKLPDSKKVLDLESSYFNLVKRASDDVYCGSINSNMPGYWDTVNNEEGVNPLHIHVVAALEFVGSSQNQWRWGLRYAFINFIYTKVEHHVHPRSGNYDGCKQSNIFRSIVVSI